jgi:hypothetical protein
MSGTTVSGGSVPNNFTGAGGATFSSVFTSTTQVSFVTPGVSTVPGAVAVTASGGTYTLSASAVADTSAGSNSLTLTKPSTVFAAPGDTVSSAAAATIFGGASGTTSFVSTGSNSSITGGAGFINGVASGANSTLVGGTGGASFTVGGAGSEAVAGNSGTTNVALTGSGEQVATSPIPGSNTGTLVANLGTGTTAESVIGGGGSSSVSAGGSTNDVFGFVKGHAGGSETISGFNSTDTFAFGGYGADPIKSEAFVANSATTGTDVITLTDGTTITVVGSLTHSIFGGG